MKVFVRTDSSVQLGSGHLMRCLTLADMLRAKGAEVEFICQELPGNMARIAQNQGFAVHLHLDKNWKADASSSVAVVKQSCSTADLLVVDNYHLDFRWERMLRPYTNKLMVIDDLANRHHDCDVLLDQNFYLDMASRYAGLVPDDCRSFLGPAYVLLRKEFRQERKNLRKRDGNVNKILVFFGGSDSTNETVKTLQAIEKIQRDSREFVCNIVAGAANSHLAQINELCSALANVRLHIQTNNMAQLMNEADLAIGAGGTATWERCYLGLPTITVIIAENQAETTNAVATTGAILNLGWYHSVDEQTIIDAVLNLAANPSELKKMSANALQIISEAPSENKLLDFLARR